MKGFNLPLTTYHLRLYIALSSSLLVLNFSCKKDQQPSVYLGYDYFPATVGHYVIYQCDSVYYNPYKAGHWDTLIYQVREVIDSIYPDNSGRPTMRIVRYMRMNADSNLSWNNPNLPEKVWSGNLLPTTAERVEDNYRYIKLIFPITLNATWNGNAYNTLPVYNYQYTSVNTPLNVGSTHFDSTVTVLQYVNSTFFQNQYYEEQYATGIGLIYKKIIDYSDTSFVSIPPPDSVAISGTAIYTETYLSSGTTTIP